MERTKRVRRGGDMKEETVKDSVTTGSGKGETSTFLFPYSEQTLHRREHGTQGRIGNWVSKGKPRRSVSHLWSHEPKTAPKG